MISIKSYSILNLCAMLFTYPLHGQTLFTIPKANPNYQSNYLRIEECEAGLQRIAIEAQGKNQVWADTAAHNPATIKTPYSPELIDTARLCVNKFSQEDLHNLPLKDLHPGAGVFLVANRDLDVDQVYSGLLKRLSGDTVVRELRNIVQVYGSARPRRTVAVRRIIDSSFPHISQDSIVPLLGLKVALAHLLMQSGDTIEAKDIFRGIIASLDTLPSKKLSNQDFILFSQFALFSQSLSLSQDEMIDSLRVSIDSYRNYLRGKLALVKGQPEYLEREDPIGERVPRVYGDFYFDALSDSVKPILADDFLNADTSSIQLIAFLRGGCHKRSHVIRDGRSNLNNIKNTGSNCLPTLSAMRRIKERYPHVSINVVSKTYGNIGDAAPMSALEEAHSLAEYFLIFHNIPGRLIVEQMPYFRIEGLDRRRIDLSTINDTSFVVNGIPLGTAGSVILIDRDRRVFHSGSISGEDEPVLYRKIEAVLGRYSQESATQ